MKFNVTDVEFDFDDMYSNDDFTCLSFDEEIELRDLALGVWEADDEDDLIEEVTTASGWCIKSICNSIGSIDIIATNSNEVSLIYFLRLR